MKYITVLFIFFSFYCSLKGMNSAFLDDNFLIKNFSEGIVNYQKGNIQEASTLLYEAYNTFQSSPLASFIPSDVLQKTYSIFSVIEDSKGNFETALDFAYKAFPNGGNNVDKGILLWHKAKDAHCNGNFQLEKECYQKAFHLFQGAAVHDRRAAHYYEHALYNGLGCTYNLSDIRKHHLEQVKAQYGYRIKGILEDPYNNALKKLLNFAEKDILTQCFIAKIYSNQEEALQYGFSYSESASLEWCKKALLNLAKIPTKDPYPLQIFTLNIVLENLCKNPSNDIKQKAFIAKKYYDLLCANKNQNQNKLQEMCSNPQNSAVQNIVIQLLCSKITESEATVIKNITFKDKDFIIFCETEGDIVIPLLKEKLSTIPSHMKIYHDVCHFIIGGYEYYYHNTDAAYNHLIQCSHYEKDLYLSAIILELYISENNTEKIKTLSNHLRRNLKQDFHEKDIQEQRLIVYCEYNPLLSEEEQLSFCKEFLLHHIENPNNQNPLEYIRFILSLNGLCKKKNEYSQDIQKKAITIEIYFDFFSALQTKDQPKIHELLSSASIRSLPLRLLLFTALSSNKKDDSKTIVFESLEFKQFYSSEAFILIPILKQIATNTITYTSLKQHQCYYLLGGFAATEGDFFKAHKYFLKCSSVYKNDLYIQTKTLEYTTVFEDVYKTLKNIPDRIDLSRKNPRNDAIKKIIRNTCEKIHSDYIPYLLSLQGADFQKYFLLTKLYHTIDCLWKIDLPHTYETLCSSFIKVEESILQTTPKIYSQLIKNPHRIHILDAIKIMFSKKSHNTNLCTCLSSLFIKHWHYLSDNQIDHSNIQQQYFKSLLCTLEHDNETKKESLGELALCQAMEHKTIDRNKALDFFDSALECGNKKALLEKVLFLKEQFSPDELSALNFSPEYHMKLLEEHSHSDDPKKNISLQLLGDYYAELPGLENQKKSFLLLNQAEKMGSLLSKSSRSLALFYLKGIQEEDKKWFQERDQKKALHYLTLTINTLEGNKDQEYYYCLYLRGLIYYNYKNLLYAYDDFKHVIQNTHNISHRAIATWLMGIIHLLNNEEEDSLLTVTLFLNEAYDLLALFLSNDASLIESTIKQFILCADKDVWSLIQTTVKTIFLERKTDIASLNFCSILGKTLLLQNNAEPLKTENRKYAIECLVYAANNNYLPAQLTLLDVKDDEVSLCDKIYYLEGSSSIDNFTVQSLLNRVYPTTILSQAELIVSLAKKNIDILKLYIAKMYINHSPVRTEDRSEKESLIDLILNNEHIKQSADTFLQNIENGKAALREHYFCATLCGSLASYSTHFEKLLYAKKCLSSCSHIESPNKELTLEVKKNLGYVYHNLASYFLHTENTNMPTAIANFIQGCELGNAECILRLSKLFLDGQPDAQQFHKDILTYLYTLHVRNPQNLITTALLKRFYAQGLTTQIQNTSVQQTVNSTIDLHTSSLLKTQKQKMHHTFKKLIHTPETLPAYIHTNIIPTETETEIFTTLLKYSELAKREKPDAYACLFLALTYFPNNIKLVKDYIHAGIINGVVKTINQASTSRFKSLILPNVLCEIVIKIINSATNRSQKLLLIKHIKSLLVQENIDVPAFEEFCKEFYNKDLTHCIGWSNKNSKKR